MRTISKYISFALMAFAVVACHTNEIDNPDNPDNPNPPQISDNVTFTASIKQTRVEYTPNGDKLDQYWKVGDVIYGFYGEGSGSKIILQVTEVDSNGYAKLEPLYDTGPAFVAELKESVKNKKTLGIGLIYTGKTNISEGSYSNPISIGDSFRDQSTGQIPACMSCYQYEDPKTDEDGNTIVEFKFKNDCAILEIKGITGAKEEANLSDEEKAELKSITVTNTCYYFKYSYDSGELSLDINTDYLWDTCVKPESLYIDSNGNIVDSNGNSKSVMIAVVPNTVENISVTAVLDGMEDPIGSSYNTDLVKGTCYIINAKPAVAKTEDGLYFSSVAGAFYRAKYLDGHRDLLNGKTNTVTLVKDYIDGLKEDVAHDTEKSYDPKIIQIDYPVTFDLNGCSLALDCDDTSREWDSYYGGGFVVETNGTLRIIDEEECGYIESCSGCPIITNSGKVEIEGGNLYHWYFNQVINSTGGLNVSGGDLYAYASPAVILSGTDAVGKITGGFIENNNSENPLTEHETIQILDGADCTISGGIVYSRGFSPTIGCRSLDNNVFSTLTVKWPTSQDPNKNDMQYGISIQQPLIYAAAPNSNSSVGFSHVPINAGYPNVNMQTFVNTAKVTVLGGYLICNPNVPWFYAGDDDTDNYSYNIDLNNFYGFFSNQCQVLKSASANSSKVDLNNNGNGNKIRKMKMGIDYPTFYATKQTNSSITLPEDKGDTGDLWLITETQVN